MAEQVWRSVKCHLLLGDWLSGRADMAPDASECRCGFWSFVGGEMCESGGPNPPSHYQFDVLHTIVFLQVLRLIPVLRYWVVCCGHRVGVIVGGWWRGWQLATHAQNPQITGSPPLTVWLGYFVWNGHMRDPLFPSLSPPPPPPPLPMHKTLCRAYIISRWVLSSQGISFLHISNKN